MRVSKICLASAVVLLASPTLAQTKGQDDAAKKRRSKIEERERAAAEAAKGEGASAGVPPLDLVRVIAAARILMPRTTLRLSAGRSSLSRGEQALAFLAGANSIFTGDTLLTTPNVAEDDDTAMFRELGLQGKPPFQGAYKAFE